jgi:hypothetical protein
MLGHGEDEAVAEKGELELHGEVWEADRFRGLRRHC